MIRLVRLTAAGQISLPADIRKQLGLRSGDFIAVELTEKGRLLLSPQALVPKEESFFHRADWQTAERDADDDLSAGLVRGPFDDVDRLLEDLKADK